MRYFSIQLIKFLVLGAVVLPVAIILWGELAPSQIKSNLKYRRGYPGHLFTRLQEVKEFGAVDLLFIGSSHAYRGIDPRYFSAQGIISFNLGSSGQTPLQAEILLDRYLEDLNPRLIVFDVSPSSFYDGIESSFDLLSNDIIDGSSLQLALQQQHLGVYVTLFYAWYRQLLKRDIGFKEEVRRGSDEYISGGYVASSAPVYHQQQQDERTWELSDQQLSKLSQILMKMKSKGINVLLVRAPVTASLFNSYTNNEYPDSILFEKGHYINFQNKVELLDTTHFYDARHLNQAGVELYNRELLKQIESGKYLH